VKSVLVGWFPDERDASLVLLWADGSLPAGQGVYVLGTPPYELLDYDGFIVSRHPCPGKTIF
jgi:CRISPR-associated protein Cas2